MKKFLTKGLGLVLTLSALAPLSAAAAEDVIITIGGPSVTLESGQKGTVNDPGNLDPRATYSVVITTNSTTEFDRSWITDGQFPVADYATFTQELKAGGYVLTYTSTPGMLFPMVIVQQTGSPVTLSVAIPSDDDIQEITSGDTFDAEKDKIYSINNDAAGNVLTVKTKVTNLTEQTADRMIGTNETCTSFVRTLTGAKDDGTYEENEGYIYLEYILPDAQDYYFKCPMAGEYTFTITAPTFDQLEESDAIAEIKSPEAGVSMFYNFTVIWKANGEIQTLSNGKIYGATLTGPQGNISLTNPAIDKLDETGDRFTTFSVNIPNSEYEKLVPGKYTLSLPKGIVVIDGKANKAVDLIYNFEPDQTLTYFDDGLETFYEPSGDLPLSSLKTVRVSFEGLGDNGLMPIYPVDNNSQEITLTLRIGEAEQEVTAEVISNYFLEITVNVESVEEFTTLEIEIPENVIRNQSEEVNPSQTLSYMLLPVANEATATPVSGSNFTDENEDWTVTVSWGENSEISLNGDPVFTLIDENGEEIEFEFYENVNINDEGNALIFDLAGIEDGKYTINIPADAVMITSLEEPEGDSSFGGGFVMPVMYLNPAQSFTYNIGELVIEIPFFDKEPVATPDNSEAVVELPSVSLSWGKVELEENLENNALITMTSVVNSNETVAQAEENYVQLVTILDNELVITFGKLVDGNYSLHVPAEYVLITSEGTQYYNNPVEMVYIVDSTSGVTAIGTDANGLFNIYNVNGVKVASGKADVINTLQPGLYIINGKKVVVK